MYSVVLTVVTLLLTSFVQSGVGSYDPILQKCCDEGRRTARHEECTAASLSPIEGLPEGSRLLCSSSMYACCLLMRRQLECRIGRNKAKSGFECANETLEERFCCEACKLGQDASLRNASCDIAGSQVGLLWESTYEACCLERQEGAADKKIHRFDNNEDCPIGFQYHASSKSCQDINECLLDLHTCNPSQRCDNSIGSYLCIRSANCGTGYTLNIETDECEDDDECALGIDNCRYLGQDYTCRNIEGSFRCDRQPGPTSLFPCFGSECAVQQCPSGYVAFGPQCIDFDECTLSNKCHSDELCLNTRGSYKCPSVKCLDGFIQHSKKLNLCSWAPGTCRSAHCKHKPVFEQYHFISLPSNLSVVDKGEKLLLIRGPFWANTTTQYTIQILKQNSPTNQKVQSSNFKILNLKNGLGVLFLVTPLYGPQEIQLMVSLKVLNKAIYEGFFSYIVELFVSEFNF